MHTVVLRGKVLLKGLEKSIQMGGGRQEGQIEVERQGGRESSQMMKQR